MVRPKKATRKLKTTASYEQIGWLNKVERSLKYWLCYFVVLGVCGCESDNEISDGRMSFK